jgi:hypothetical protein
MTLKRIALLAAAVAGFVALQGASAYAQSCGSGAAGKICVYSVKFICGTQNPVSTAPPVEPPVKPGNYATAVNIQNFHAAATKISLRAVVANPAGTATGAISAASSIGLVPYQGLEVDCAQIVALLKRTDPQPPPFIKGFVDIQSTVILSVVGVYTAEQIGGNGKAPVSVDVVPQTPFAP